MYIEGETILTATTSTNFEEIKNFSTDQIASDRELCGDYFGH